MSANADLREYYAARAGEYERIYAKPERQADLARLRKTIPLYFSGRNVLEIACGTGYWTAVIAPLARHVTATDINEETLAIARAKPLPHDKVALEIADVYRLPPRCAGFDAAFAGFWWSHVRRAERHHFVACLHRALAPGAVVLALDNRYVEGSSTPISHSDAEGNTYQRRGLDDGSEHTVLKNFPTLPELIADIGQAGTAFEYITLEYYWVFRYEISRTAQRSTASTGA